MRGALAAAILVGAVLAPAAATAHPTDTFDACVTSRAADFCEDTFSYVYGDTVVLKGDMSPTHTRAMVLLRAPGEDRWERVRWVGIGEGGGMTFRWHTHRPDAVQDAPYLLRFRIPGHGHSDVVEAYVLFGE